MRSFFKKPEWASKTAETQSDFYRRSGQTYSDIVAANQAAHRRPKTPSDMPGETLTEESRHSKRPRTSDEPEEASDIAGSAQPVEKIEPGESHTPSPLQDLQIQREPAAFNKEKSPKVTPNEILGASSSKQRPRPGHPSPPNPQNRGRPVQKMNEIDLDEAKESLPCSSNTESYPQPSEQPTISADDPIVQILITSEIRHSKPLIVHRKMSQRLRDVRVEWCKRQDIPTEAQSSVYLTWRGRRLFDVTTCKSLGVKAEKNTAILGIEDDSTAGQRELRIHMVATTENTDLLDRPALSPSARDTPLPPSNPEDQQNQQMKLILRNPDFDDFKIKARPKTLVSKLISAFRDKQDIAIDQDLLLFFDGDRLDPHTCLRDHDIADLDMLEIQIKPRSDN